MNVGAQTYSGGYTDYKDFQEYGVRFPSRISQKNDGAPVAEFTVSEALANPYLIFPPPKLETVAPSDRTGNRAHRSARGRDRRRRDYQPR
jgi:hypothetical protein